MIKAFQLIRPRPEIFGLRALCACQRSAVFSLAVMFAMFCGGTQQTWAAGSATTTTLAITSSGSVTAMVTHGSVITLTATVKAGSTGVTTGRVNFCDATAIYCTDIHLLGSAQLTSAGTASLKFVPGIGSHNYKAVFAGTGSDASSTSASSALQVSGSYPTTTAIAQSGSQGNYTLTATLTGTGGAVPPTGTVSFLDTSNGNYSLGTAAPGQSTTVVTLSSSSVPSTGDNPYSIAVGDFNGDGLADIVTVNNGSDTVTVLLGNGDGTFTATPLSPATGNEPYAIAVGDFNGDGKADLAVVNAGDSTVTVLLGNGDGTFTPLTPVSTGSSSTPISIVVGDFNGDGNADIALTIAANNTVSILSGNGDGTFTLATGPSTGNYPYSIATGDLSGDGNADLVVANTLDNTVTVMLGAGNGSFTAMTPISTGSGSSPISVAVGDFNGDGKADVAVANFGTNTVTVLLGNGDGSFTAAASPSTGVSPYSIAVGDINGDGVPDLVTANFGDNTATVLLGKGDGTFTAVTSPSVGSYPYSVAMGLFNTGGKATPAVANFGDGTVTVLQTQITQTSAAIASNIAPVGSGTHAVEASYSGDSIYGSSISSTTDLTAQQVATTLTLTANPANSTYGQSVTLTATLSPFQTQSHTAGGSVTFYDGAINLGTVPLSSGVAVSVQSSLPVGSDSLSAVYSGDTDFLGSNASATVGVISDFSITLVSASSLDVPPGQPAQYSFQVSPLPPTSGYPDVVTFAATGLPPGATAVFTPNNIPVNAGPQTVALTIQTVLASEKSGAPDAGHDGLAPMLLGLLLLPLARMRRSRQRFGRLLSMLLMVVGLATGLVAMASIAGCGSHNGYFGQQQQSYSVTVTATSGSVVHSTTVNLTVQ